MEKLQSQEKVLWHPLITVFSTVIVFGQVLACSAMSGAMYYQLLFVILFSFDLFISFFCSNLIPYTRIFSKT